MAGFDKREKLVAYLLNYYSFSMKKRKNSHLTNTFHSAVRLFSYRSQMTSKCGKNKKLAQEPLGEWVTDVLATF